MNAPQRELFHLDKLRTCREISEFYFGDPGRWRKINELCKKGRFPHWKEGSAYCASKRTIRRWIALQQRLAIEGKALTSQEILKHLILDDDDE